MSIDMEGLCFCGVVCLASMAAPTCNLQIWLRDIRIPRSWHPSVGFHASFICLTVAHSRVSGSQQGSTFDTGCSPNAKEPQLVIVTSLTPDNILGTHVVIYCLCVSPLLIQKTERYRSLLFMAQRLPLWVLACLLTLRQRQHKS